LVPSPTAWPWELSTIGVDVLVEDVFVDSSALFEPQAVSDTETARKAAIRISFEFTLFILFTVTTNYFLSMNLSGLFKPLATLK
jgi:hypothetical protein